MKAKEMYKGFEICIARVERNPENPAFYHMSFTIRITDPKTEEVVIFVEEDTESENLALRKAKELVEAHTIGD